MKPFNDYLDSVGQLKRYPRATYKWAAYKNGVVTFHNTRPAAIAVSNNVEQIETEESKEARKEVHDHNMKLERDAFDAWWYDFQLVYQEMPSKLFEVIYAEAYDQAHSSGYDAIGDKFASLAYFADRVIHATK